MNELLGTVSPELHPKNLHFGPDAFRFRCCGNYICHQFNFPLELDLGGVVVFPKWYIFNVWLIGTHFFFQQGTKKASLCLH